MNAIQRVQEAIKEIQKGNMVIMMKIGKMKVI
jgi:hypothetical protein